MAIRTTIVIHGRSRMFGKFPPVPIIMTIISIIINMAKKVVIIIIIIITTATKVVIVIIIIIITMAAKVVIIIIIIIIRPTEMVGRMKLRLGRNNTANPVRTPMRS